MEKAEITIVGAGVIGLAIANELAEKHKDVVVIERHKTFGQEASSRNSEVIHAGIYYVPLSLKSKLCVEGKMLLYQFCRDHNIPHKRLGKLIVATNDDEVNILEKLIRKGVSNGVDDLRLLTKDEMRKIEPNIHGIGAIYSPSTGIIDTHQFMKRLESLAKNRGVVFAYNCEVVGIDRKEGEYKIDIRDSNGERIGLLTRVLINSAGLNSEKIAEMAGIDIEKARYRLHYCKGEYFRVKGNKSKLISHLVYPPPEENGLGIHTVPDLQGQLRLGPNAFYVNDINYDVEPSHITEFYEYAKRTLPFMELSDLNADMAGIRPKLQGPTDAVRDFVISNEAEVGLLGLINLIGIESPGLTASLSIAKYVDSVI